MSIKVVSIPGSPNLYLRGTLRGVKVYETCGTTSPEAAETIRAKREWEILQGSIFGAASTATLIDAAIVYLENGGEARFTKPITDHFKSTPLAKIDQAAADACARKLYPNCGPATLVRQVYTPLTAMINAAAKRKLCAPVKFERPKMPKGRVRWITHVEADRLLTAMPPHLYPLVAFLLYTGARCGEALCLDWRFVDLKRAQVQFLDTKNGTDRGVPLHPALVAILANLPHRTGCVFRKQGRLIKPTGFMPRNSNSGEPIVREYALGDPYTPLDPDDDRDVSAGSRIKKGFKAACVRAEIDDFSPHDCRHTWATWHYQQHRDLNLLKDLGGWSSLSMVLRYAHVNVEHRAPSIAAMPTIGGTPPAAPRTASAGASEAEREAAAR